MIHRGHNLRLALLSVIALAILPAAGFAMDKIDCTKEATMLIGKDGTVAALTADMDGSKQVICYADAGDMELKSMLSDKANQTSAISIASAHAIAQAGNTEGFALGVGMGYVGGEFGVALGTDFDIAENLSVTTSVARAKGGELALGAGISIGF